MRRAGRGGANESGTDPDSFPTPWVPSFLVRINSKTTHFGFPYLLFNPKPSLGLRFSSRVSGPFLSSTHTLTSVFRLLLLKVSLGTLGRTLLRTLRATERPSSIPGKSIHLGGVIYRYSSWLDGWTKRWTRSVSKSLVSASRNFICT